MYLVGYVPLESRCPRIAGTHANPQLKRGTTVLLGADGCVAVGSGD